MTGSFTPQPHPLRVMRHQDLILVRTPHSLISIPRCASVRVVHHDHAPGAGSVLVVTDGRYDKDIEHHLPDGMASEILEKVSQIALRRNYWPVVSSSAISATTGALVTGLLLLPLLFSSVRPPDSAMTADTPAQVSTVAVAPDNGDRSHPPTPNATAASNPDVERPALSNPSRAADDALAQSASAYADRQTSDTGYQPPAALATPESPSEPEPTDGPRQAMRTAAGQSTLPGAFRIVAES